MIAGASAPTLRPMLATEVSPRSTHRDGLLDAVADVEATLTAHAAEAEEQRTLPRVSVEALREHGLFAMAAPLEVNGLEVDPLTQMEVVEAVSRIDTSAGWTLMIGAHGAQVIGTFASDRACERVFGGPHWPISGSQVAPFCGTFERVAGGILVTGRWSFASGIRHADFSMLTAGEAGHAPGDGPVPQLGAVVPAAELTLHDVWHTAGLKGTGSCDYSLERHFVPDEMTWELPPRLQRGGPRYAIKTPQAALAAFALGAARRSLDEIARQARSKYRPGSTTSVAARPHVHHALGEAEMRLRAARAGLFELVGEMWECARAGERVSAEHEALLSASPAHCFDVARHATTTALSFGGSKATYLDNVLQRNFRDVAVGAQHVQASEQAYEGVGTLLLRLEPQAG